MKPLEPIPLPVIRAAAERISEIAIRTPLIRLNMDDTPGEIYLKLENLQPIGSFKIRGAANAMLSAPSESLTNGVYTASAGNMAQGVAWVARRLGIPCRVVVPEHAPQTKLKAIARLGGEVIPVPFDEWWRVLIEHRFAGLDGLFVHPFSQSSVIAGNGTIGLEIFEDLPDVETIIVPFGGGGLSCGIASALRALKPQVKVFASEVETAAPLAASFMVGKACDIDHTPSFVDGIGGKGVLPEMWTLVNSLLAGSKVVGLEAIAESIRLLVQRNRVIAEGAGASSVAAALASEALQGKVVCVISGGNIDKEKLACILRGELPCGS